MPSRSLSVFRRSCSRSACGAVITGSRSIASRVSSAPGPGAPSQPSAWPAPNGQFAPTATSSTGRLPPPGSARPAHRLTRWWAFRRLCRAGFRTYGNRVQPAALAPDDAQMLLDDAGRAMIAGDWRRLVSGRGAHAAVESARGQSVLAKRSRSPTAPATTASAARQRWQMAAAFDMSGDTAMGDTWRTHAGEYASGWPIASLRRRRKSPWPNRQGARQRARRRRTHGNGLARNRSPSPGVVAGAALPDDAGSLVAEQPPRCTFDTASRTLARQQRFLKTAHQS